MNKLAFITLILITPLPGLSQSNQSWKSKISNFVSDQYKTKGKVEYFVYFNGKPDLSKVHSLKIKIEKTKYVYETLKSFSENSQKEIKQFR